MEYKRVSYAFYTSSPQFLPFFPSPPPLEFVPISNEILETIEIFLVPFFFYQFWVSMYQRSALLQIFFFVC